MVNGFHTNGIENFWNVLKRGIYGIYHQVSRKHLQRYCDEFGARYNTRELKDNQRFELSVQKSNGRLKYKQLILLLKYHIHIYIKKQCSLSSLPQSRKATNIQP